MPTGRTYENADALLKAIVDGTGERGLLLKIAQVEPGALDISIEREGETVGRMDLVAYDGFATMELSRLSGSPGGDFEAILETDAFYGQENAIEKVDFLVERMSELRLPEHSSLPTP